MGNLRRIRLTFLSLIPLLALHLVLPVVGVAPAQSSNVVACRVLEAHTSPELRVVTVVFHQQDKIEGPRLGALLVQHSGTSVEFQTADGDWHHASVFRLKSCFGRGLLIFSTDAAKLADRDNFVLRFPTK